MAFLDDEKRYPPLKGIKDVNDLIRSICRDDNVTYINLSVPFGACQ